MHRWIYAGLLLVAGLAMTAGAQRASIGGVAGYVGGQPAYHTGQVGDQTLMTTAGEHIDVVFDGGRRAYYGFRTLRDGRHAVLADGVYNLTNRGAVRVSGGGHIVWDAFGVVERVVRDPSAHPGTDKG